MDRENEVISCLAGALWPALPQRATGSVPATQADCWRMTASDCPQISIEVLNVIHNCLNESDKRQLLLLLWLLRFRLPTLLLAGHRCLQLQHPLVCSLPEMGIEAVQATLQGWAYSYIPHFRKAYKAVKAIVASAILSHIDPATGTNPFFPAAGYTPGSKVQEQDLGPEQPVAAIEELLASATVHVPELVAQGKDVQAYLVKRGFHCVPAADPASTTVSHSTGHSRGCPSAVKLCYDAVVVGSGAGGGVSAALLAAAGMKVLVLEKASWVRSQDMSWLEADAHAEMYERAGFLTSHDGGISILAGSTLGGGTKINWTASLKTPDHVRQEWASWPHQLTHLAPGAAAFDEALSAVLQRLGVSTGTQMSGPNARLMQGCHALGLHVEELSRNCLSKTCSAYCNFGCRSGHKQSSDVSWLIDAVKSGAQVLTGVEGQRLMIEQQTVGDRPKKVVGIIAVSSTKRTPGDRSSTLQQMTLDIKAPLVIVSCGSIHTPALLLRSGVTVGGNVGKHLRLHPAAGMISVFNPDEGQEAGVRGAVNMYKGVSMGSFSRAAANWESGGYGAMVSVPAAHPGLLAALCPDHQLGQLKELCMQLPNSSCCVIFTRDSSSGSVEIDKEGRPVIKYWPCQQTMQHMLDGVAVACRALAAAGAVRILVPNSLHDWQLNLNPKDPLAIRQQQLEQFLTCIRRDGVPKYSMPVLSAHQMGSCRMGSAPGSSVVDASGECWDVSGLFVADASLFPTASGVNPMITVYGLSYLVASTIAQRWKAASKTVNGNAKKDKKDLQTARDQAEVS